MTLSASPNDTRPRPPDHPGTGLRPTLSSSAARRLLVETDRAPRDAGGDEDQRVFWIPLDGVDRHLLRTSAIITATAPTRARLLTTTSSATRGRTRGAVVWYYEDPFPAVAGIKGHVAFYASPGGRQGHTHSVQPAQHTSGKQP